MSDVDHVKSLQRYCKRNRVFPAMAKLREVAGLSSSAGVFGMVGRLTETGHLQRLDGRVALGPKFFARPLLGDVRAGLPQPATQQEPDVLTLNKYLIDERDRTMLHRARGDSMAYAHIAYGDLVVVEENSATKAGDIVLAVVDGESAVKTLGLKPRTGISSRRQMQPMGRFTPDQARTDGRCRQRRETCAEVTS